MAEWQDIPFEESLFLSVDEASVSNAATAMENLFINDAKGHTRWPVSRPFATLDGERTYLADWRNNLIATTSTGRVWIIDKDGNPTDATGAPLSGGRRATFCKTDQELVMAAGAQIISLGNAGKSQVLSTQAPLSTHVATIDGFLFAIEPFSGLFDYTNPEQYDGPSAWPALNTFSADALPDDLNAMVVTPFRELLLCGEDSIEQWEPLPGATTVPFFRRYTSGEGLFAPYTLCATKVGTFGLNKEFEFVQFFNQSIAVVSADIQGVLEQIDDVTDAWAVEIKIQSQKFILLQFPNATNPYGTQGYTFLLDYKNKHWSLLYDWDDALALPTRYRAWSYHSLWNRRFIGVPGGVEELDLNRFDRSKGTQRMLYRTGHIDKWGHVSRIDNVTLRFKRGMGAPNDSQPGAARSGSPGVIGLRVNRDNEGFGPWVYRDIGAPGDSRLAVDFGGFGCARTWQFEYQVTDAALIEFTKGRALVEPLEW